MKVIFKNRCLSFREIKHLTLISFFIFSFSLLQASYSRPPIFENTSEKSPTYLAYKARQDIQKFLGLGVNGSFISTEDQDGIVLGGKVVLKFNFPETMALSAKLRELMGEYWRWSSEEPVSVKFSLPNGHSLELPLSFPSELSSMIDRSGSAPEDGIDFDSLCEQMSNKSLTLSSEFSDEILLVLLDPTSPVKNVSLTLKFVKHRASQKNALPWQERYFWEKQLKLMNLGISQSVATAALRKQLGLRVNKPFSNFFEGQTREGREVSTVHSGTKNFETYSITIPNVPLNNLSRLTDKHDLFSEALSREIKHPHDYFKLIFYKKKLEEDLKKVGLVWTKNYKDYIIKKMEDLKISFIQDYRVFHKKQALQENYLFNLNNKLKSLILKELNQANQEDLENFIAQMEESIRKVNPTSSLQEYLEQKYFCYKFYSFYGITKEKMDALKKYWEDEENNRFAHICSSHQHLVNPIDSIYGFLNSYSKIYSDSQYDHSRIRDEYLKFERDLILGEVNDLLQAKSAEDQQEILSRIEQELRSFRPEWAQNSYARKIQRQVKSHLAPKFSAARILQDFARQAVLPNSSGKHRASKLIQKVARRFLEKKKIEKKTKAANAIRQFYLDHKSLRQVGSRRKLPDYNSYKLNNSSLAAKRTIPYSLYWESDPNREINFILGAFDEVNLETGELTKSSYQNDPQFLISDESKAIEPIYVHLDVLSFNEHSKRYEAPLPLPHNSNTGLPILVPKPGLGYSIRFKAGQYYLSMTKRNLLRALRVRKDIDDFFSVNCFPLDVKKTQDALFSLEAEKKAIDEFHSTEWQEIIQAVETEYNQNKEDIESFCFHSESSDFKSEKDFIKWKERQLAELPLRIPHMLTHYIKTHYKYSNKDEAIGLINPLQALQSRSFQCDTAAAIMLSILKYHFGFQGRIFGQAPGVNFQGKRKYLNQSGSFHALVQVWMPEIEGCSKAELKVFDPTPYEKVAE